LYIKPHQILASLDPLCSQPTTSEQVIDHGLQFLQPREDFVDIIEDLFSKAPELIACGTLLSQAEAMRGPSKKRSSVQHMYIGAVDDERTLKRR
jgi:hypothetical protein